MTFAEHWPQPGSARGEDWKPPAGNYTVEIVDTDAWVTPDGRELGKIELEIVEGPHAGKSWLHWLSFKNASAAGFAHDALSLYGVELANVKRFDDLADAMHPILGRRAEVTVDDRGFTKVDRAFTGQSDIPVDDEIPF